MAQLSLLLGRVNDEFSSVPEAVALRALSDATKEFCTETHAWQETLSPIQLQAGVSVYELDLDSGVQLVDIKDLRFDGRKVYALAGEVVNRARRTPTGQGVEYYVMTSPTSLEIVPANTRDSGELVVKAALTLRLDAQTTNIPDSVLDEYGEALAAGAKMRLIRQANQPWFAPDAAVLYAGVFYGAIRNAKSRVIASLGDASLQVEMRSW